MSHRALYFALLFSPSYLLSAPITWTMGDAGGFIDADGHTRIATNGTFVKALNLGGIEDLDVDTGSGVFTFAAAPADTLPNNAFDTSGESAVASSNASWVAILHRADYSAADPGTLVIDGLTIGTEYQIELFAYDNRNAGISARTQTYSDEAGAGNTSDVITNSGGISVIGTFTADADTQNIYLSQSATDPTLNAYSLIEVDGDDTDGDGLPDNYELSFPAVTDLDDLTGFLPAPGASGSGSGDFDGDGLADIEEFQTYFTDPTLADTDEDTLFDLDEINGTNGFTTSPLKSDTDEDGLDDAVEPDPADGFVTDPTKADTDGDQMDDLYEQLAQNVPPGLDPTSSADAGLDLDGDGLKNLEEYDPTTGPNILSPRTLADDTDTDDDNIDDLAETTTGTWASITNTGSNPTLADTDGDNINDGQENPDDGVDGGPIYKSNPNTPDSDLDGLTDGEEVALGTKPDDQDTDGDNYEDSLEVSNGSDPLLDTSTPITVNGILIVADDDIEGANVSLNTPVITPWTALTGFGAPYGGFLPLAVDDDEGIGEDGDQLPLEALNGSVPYFNNPAAPTVTYVGTLASGTYSVQIQIVNFNNVGFPEFNAITLGGVEPVESITPAPDAGDDEVWTLIYEVLPGDPNIGAPLTLIVPTVPDVGGNAGLDHVYITYTNVIGGLDGLAITEVDTSNLSSREVVLHWTPLPRISNYILNFSSDLENWSELDDNITSTANPDTINITLDSVSFPTIPGKLYFQLVPSNN